MKIKSEELAYWYLRLNGFLTIQNFIIHPDTGKNQRTDADILGVRFPYRAELNINPMVDSEPFTLFKDRPYIVIAEVKKSVCDLNGPWTEPKKENLQRVLRAIGAFDLDKIKLIAKEIYTNGVFSDDTYYITLACFGETINQDINKRFPKVPQIQWEEVLSFIYRRFKDYKSQKVSHGQWDHTGKGLWEIIWKAKNLEELKSAIKILGK